MKIKSIAIILSVVFLGGLAVEARTVKQPNIVLIYMDDLGWKDIGCCGSRFYKTPNIDRLARQGMRFTHAYSAAPICSPSRGAVLSGKFPGRTQFTAVMQTDATDDSLYTQSKILGVGNQNLEALHRHVLPRGETLFAERLKAGGYRNCFFGKWHCGHAPGFRPHDRGYDEVHAFFSTCDGARYPHYLMPADIDEMEGLPKAKPGDYLSEAMSVQACDFIEEHMELHADKPFLLHLCHFLVHAPIVPKKGLPEQYAERLKTVKSDQDHCQYASMIESMDDSVGMIMDQLERLGLLENTLVLFSSDNGGLTLHEFTSNYPLMGGKSFAYEGGYRVPLIACWKDRISPGTLNSTRTVGMDLYPTLLEAAGLDLDPKQHVDGLSLLGELTDGREGHLLPVRPLYFHHPHYTHASSPHSIIIDGDYKLIRYYNDEEGGYALFNLIEDPYEQKDLFKEQPETVAVLGRKLRRFLVETGSQMPVPAESAEGRRSLELHARGQTKGWFEKTRNLKKVFNKKTERELALAERALQEGKLK